ncbi:MAG: prepilin-type N-terminal cleavage/methylation domain-containing protein [Nitrosomonadales bacterium]|nr:prepilin-type N-terminal cleavage/methylation domain-containing protein [Nitrosomonadales bacterium]
MQEAGRKNTKGYTLIEIMIVVVIIGIIAAVAIPQYKQYVIRGNRSAAQAFMMDIANRQKQYLLDARVYAPDLTTLTMTVPTNVSNNYSCCTMTLNASGTAPSFTITATPIAGKAQANDGNLTLDDLGNKGATPSKW